MKERVYQKLFKRGLDITICVILLLIIFPLWLVVSLAISLDSNGGISFTQERLGYRGKIFLLYKFRSMRINKSRKENQIFKEHPDITKLGYFLRRFKIDETPQLLNVLKGDMSLIGPRPCLPALRRKFDQNGELRLAVRPGLTGWAQVNGNIYNSWEKRWEYDAYYVNNISLLLDLKILVKTFWVVLNGEQKQ